MLCSAISLLCHWAASVGSSQVWNAAQISPWKWHDWLPRHYKDCWRSARESSVWIQSFTNACHLHSQKRRCWMDASWAGGKRSLKTGMQDYSRSIWVLEVMLEAPNRLNTWSTCSKNHTGHWKVSATSGGNWQMVLWPNGEICVNLYVCLSITCSLEGGGPHCSLSVSILWGLMAYIIWSRCFRIDSRHQAQNSCSKSMTRIRNNLNHKGDSCLQK